MFLGVFSIMNYIPVFCAQDRQQSEKKLIVGENKLIVEDKKLIVGEKKLIVVFIHGTLFPYPSFRAFGSSLHTFLEKGRRLKKSWYQLYLDKVRSNSVYKHQFIGEEGLNKVDLNQDLGKGRYPYNIVGAHIYQSLIQHIPSHRYRDITFYTFGWDGRLDGEKRKYWAEILYNDLSTELSKIKQPYELMIVSHSHGGNVALNLARIHEKQHKLMSVDKLVLLGTPIQSETEGLVSSLLFKKIYNLYSKDDLFQVADFLSTQDGRSRRCFRVAKHEEQSCAKLIQIEVKVAQKSPSHAELWLFGSAQHMLYRKSLPTYPLPVVAFIPAIIDGIDTSLPMAENALLVLNRKGPLYTVKIEDRDPEVRAISSMKIVLSVRASDVDPYVAHLVKE